MITPTQEHFRPWTIDKMHSYHFGSPASEASATIFFDAEERIRIEPTMEDIQAALKEQTQATFDEAYQSSEEALSPLLEEEATAGDAEDEDTADYSDEKNAFWSDLDSFKIDIAVAVCVAAAGKAKVVNVPQRWATFRGLRGVRPSRSNSPAPSMPVRSSARLAALRLNTYIPTQSISTPTTAGSSRSTSSASQYSSTRPQGSSHRVAPSIASATSWAPSTSDQSLYSVTASFLESDPYESTHPKNTKRSRLRSISSKLISSSSSLNTNEPSEQSGLVDIKQKRRRSLVNAVRPETQPFFFSQRSRDEWHREQARSSTPPLSASTTAQQTSFPKLMARGANEREPTLQLPPCPTDYDQELPAINPFSMPNTKKASAQIGRRQSLRLRG
jgi:hypothetical protein